MASSNVPDHAKQLEVDVIDTLRAGWLHTGNYPTSMAELQAGVRKLMENFDVTRKTAASKPVTESALVAGSKLVAESKLVTEDEADLLYMLIYPRVIASLAMTTVTSTHNTPTTLAGLAHQTAYSAVKAALQRKGDIANIVKDLNGKHAP